MPKFLLDPKDRQAVPAALRAPLKGRTWQHVDALGDWRPLGDKRSTGRTTRLEKERGIISLKYEADGIKELVLAEDRIMEEAAVLDTVIDMEVKDDGVGAVGSPSSGTLGDGEGAARAAVDLGGRTVGRTERMVPR